jgi:hypothetical protein
MKAATIFHLALGLMITLSFSLPQQSLAQDSDYVEPSEKYSREELAQMLAPIALYPDALLSQVLMASTYPIEVIEADRWVKRNGRLRGEALDTALLDKDWDPSVKAMCHFPSILALMSERITETTNLGNAFLAQEAEVMDMVQELRAKAYAQGNLTTTSQQKVIAEKGTIIIEPADPRVIYVPYYDPFYIYGPWWYPAYPPYYWAPPGVSVGIGISYWPGFYFGFVFGTWSYFDWPHHYIFIDFHKRPRYVRHDRWISKPGPWHHNPTHRRGVAYRDKPTARRYGQYPYRSRHFDRDTRGFPTLRDRDLGEDRRVDDRTRIGRYKGAEDRLKVGRNSQAPQRVDSGTQRAERAQGERQARERVEGAPQIRQGTGQETQLRQQVEPEQQARSRDNVFNWVGDGRIERQSSERGQASRQGWSHGARDAGHWGGDARGGSGSWGRSRR